MICIWNNLLEIFELLYLPLCRDCILCHHCIHRILSGIGLSFLVLCRGLLYDYSLWSEEALVYHFNQVRSFYCYGKELPTKDNLCHRFCLLHLFLCSLSFWRKRSLHRISAFLVILASELYFEMLIIFLELIWWCCERFPLW